MMKEKTISKQPKRVKGTVLFTVVAVMMVMIVFLVGTLALAVTANNRAMNKFNRAQTQQTAQAGIDGIMTALQTDKMVAIAAAQVNSSHTHENVTVAFDDPSLGRITSAAIDYVGQQWILDTEVGSATENQMVPKDVVRVSVTAEQGREDSSVALYLLRDYTPTESDDGNSNGFVATGEYLGSSNHVSAFGGTYLGFNKTFKNATEDIPYSGYNFDFGNGQTLESNVQVNGDLTFSSGDGSFVIKKPATGLAVWGDMTLSQTMHAVSENIICNDTTDTMSGKNYTEIPYIYVEKKFSMGSNAKTVGNPDIPLNLFCGYAEIASQDTRIYADMYCYDAGQTTVFKSNSKAQLYKWASGIINADNSTNATNKYKGGNIYTKGNLTVESVDTKFNDLVVEGELTVKEPLTINGDLWIKRPIKFESNGKITVVGTVHCTDAAQVDTSKVQKDISAYEYHAETRTNVPDDDYEKQTEVREYDLVWINTGWQHWVLMRKVTRNGVEIENGEYNCSIENNQNSDPSVSHTARDYSTGQELIPGVPDTIDVWVSKTTGAIANSQPTKEQVNPAYYTDKATGAVVTGISTAPTLDVYPTTKKIFPAEYEKKVILGLEQLGTKDIEETQIIQTVKQMLNSQSDPYITITEIPDENDYKTKVEENRINFSHDSDHGCTAVSVQVTKADGTKEWQAPSVANGKSTLVNNPSNASDNIVITDSCTISGLVYKNKLEFRVDKGKEIWVVIDRSGLNFPDNGQILLNDLYDTSPAGVAAGKGQGKVNILLQGNLSFSSAGDYRISVASIQNKLETSGAQYQIYTDTSLQKSGVSALTDEVKINLYSTEGVLKADGTPDTSTPVKISSANGTCLIANIKAPHLDLDFGSNSTEIKATVYYNNQNVRNSVVTGGCAAKVGCIGCCIIHKFGVPNDWAILYVPKVKTTDPPDTDTYTDALLKSWKILNYENY